MLTLSVCCSETSGSLAYWNRECVYSDEKRSVSGLQHTDQKQMQFITMCQDCIQSEIRALHVYDIDTAQNSGFWPDGEPAGLTESEEIAYETEKTDKRDIVRCSGSVFDKHGNAASFSAAGSICRGSKSTCRDISECGRVVLMGCGGNKKDY